jgi:hypothetical protein
MGIDEGDPNLVLLSEVEDLPAVIGEFSEEFEPP